MRYTFISCADKKRTKEAADGGAPRNPLRRSHFQDANGIEVSEALTPLRLYSVAKAVGFIWLLQFDLAFGVYLRCKW